MASPSRRPTLLRHGAAALLCGLAALGLAACDQPQAAAPAERPVAATVTTVAVESRPLTRQVVASGTVKPWEEIVIGAESQGLAVVEVTVDEGDTVTQGQVLLRLNDAVLKAQFDQQTANLAAAKAALAEAQANLARAQDLQAHGNVSRQSLDERLAAQRTASAQVAVAEAALTEIKTRLDQAVVKSPVAGIVSKRSVNLGQVVSVGNELFRVIRDGRLELNAEVPEVSFAGLHDGLAALVRAEGLGTQVQASLRRLSPTVDARTRLGIAYVALPVDSGLKPGMFATAVIALDTAPVLVLPEASVVWRDGQEGAFKVDAQGIVHFTPVTTGLRREGMVEIKSGLAAGDLVAFRGAGFLADGDHVDVVEAKS